MENAMKVVPAKTGALVSLCTLFVGSCVRAFDVYLNTTTNGLIGAAILFGSTRQGKMWLDDTMANPHKETPIGKIWRK